MLVRDLCAIVCSLRVISVCANGTGYVWKGAIAWAAAAPLRAACPFWNEGCMIPRAGHVLVARWTVATANLGIPGNQPAGSLDGGALAALSIDTARYASAQRAVRHVLF